MIRSIYRKFDFMRMRNKGEKNDSKLIMDRSKDENGVNRIKATLEFDSSKARKELNEMKDLMIQIKTGMKTIRRDQKRAKRATDFFNRYFMSRLH